MTKREKSEQDSMKIISATLALGLFLIIFNLIF